MSFHIHSQEFYDPNQDIDYWQDDKKHALHHIPRSHSYAYPPHHQSQVFDLEDEWSRFPHQNTHYTFPSPPRIKQEDLYSDSHLRSATTYDSYHPQSLLSPLQTHHQPVAQQTAYYSPTGYHNQPQNQLHHLPRSTFQPFVGTIHPSELSPVTDSTTSVSPTLSNFTDLSNVVVQPHDSHYVCQPQPTISLKSWEDESRPSIDADHPMNPMDIGMDHIDGMALGMAGVVVGGMPIDMPPAVGEGCPEDGGEVDAEGDDDWEHAPIQDPQQSQFQPTQQIEYISGSEDASFTEDESARAADTEHPIDSQNQSQTHQQHQQQHQHHVDDDGEDEVPVEESDSAEDGEGESEIKQEYDSDFSESEEDEDEDDPHDPEFVPRSRRRPTLRRQSTFPADHGEQDLSFSGQYVSTIPFSNITSEGRNLRPRSSSGRYTPYPSSYPETSSAGLYSNEQEYDGNPNSGYSERANGRRHNSTSSGTSSSTHPPRSASSLSGSSGITTTTQTTRRRLRPSNTLPVPVPVPNLTKKSRGRRVPTMTSLEDVRSAASGAGRKRQSAGGKSARMYLCDVDGCGKCFARGEHLKRHVRSIHTYEKPHKCLYPGCGKDFSRHDNLGQHMRVHKDYVQEGVTVPGTNASHGSASRRKTVQA